MNIVHWKKIYFKCTYVESSIAESTFLIVGRIFLFNVTNKVKTLLGYL